MKEIKAIVQPWMAQHVIDALKAMPDVPGVTVSEVKGFGKDRAENAEDKVVESSIGYAKKTKLEIVVPDHMLEPVLAVICEKAHTGRIGDGKVFVYSVEDVVKIRTGQRGEAAI